MANFSSSILSPRFNRFADELQLNRRLFFAIGNFLCRATLVGHIMDQLQVCKKPKIGRNVQTSHANAVTVRGQKVKDQSHQAK